MKKKGKGTRVQGYEESKGHENRELRILEPSKPGFLEACTR